MNANDYLSGMLETVSTIAGDDEKKVTESVPTNEVASEMDNAIKQVEERPEVATVEKIESNSQVMEQKPATEDKEIEVTDANVVKCKDFMGLLGDAYLFLQRLSVYDKEVKFTWKSGYPFPNSGVLRQKNVVMNKESKEAALQYIDDMGDIYIKYVRVNYHPGIYAILRECHHSGDNLIMYKVNEIMKLQPRATRASAYYTLFMILHKAMQEEVGSTAYTNFLCYFDNVLSDFSSKQMTRVEYYIAANVNKNGLEDRPQEVIFKLGKQINPNYTVAYSTSVKERARFYELLHAGYWVRKDISPYMDKPIKDVMPYLENEVNNLNISTEVINKFGKYKKELSFLIGLSVDMDNYFVEVLHEHVPKYDWLMKAVNVTGITDLFSLLLLERVMPKGLNVKYVVDDDLDNKQKLFMYECIEYLDLNPEDFEGLSYEEMKAKRRQVLGLASDKPVFDRRFLEFHEYWGLVKFNESDLCEILASGVPLINTFTSVTEDYDIKLHIYKRAICAMRHDLVRRWEQFKVEMWPRMSWTCMNERKLESLGAPFNKYNYMRDIVDLYHFGVTSSTIKESRYTNTGDLMNSLTPHSIQLESFKRRIADSFNDSYVSENNNNDNGRGYRNYYEIHNIPEIACCLRQLEDISQPVKYTKEVDKDAPGEENFDRRKAGGLIQEYIRRHTIGDTPYTRETVNRSTIAASKTEDSIREIIIKSEGIDSIHNMDNLKKLLHIKDDLDSLYSDEAYLKEQIQLAYEDTFGSVEV